jgi:hypothetical protein
MPPNVETMASNACTLAYYDQRVRREAFDIEHMMRLMNPPENLASGASPS